MFDESWRRNVEAKLTANLHQDYVQPLITQISEEELDNALKESQTSWKEVLRSRLHTSTNALSHRNFIQNCISLAF